VDLELSVIDQFGRALFVENSHRKYPGVCVQGDTFYLWLREIAELVSVTPSAGQEQLLGLGRELYEITAGYVDLCVSRQQKVPFEWPDPVIESAGFSDLTPSTS